MLHGGKRIIENIDLTLAVWTCEGLVFPPFLCHYFRVLSNHISLTDNTLSIALISEGGRGMHVRKKGAPRGSVSSVVLEKACWKLVITIITCLAWCLCFVKGNNLRAEVSWALKTCRDGMMRPFKTRVECIPLKKDMLTFYKGFGSAFERHFMKVQLSQLIPIRAP